MTPQENQTIAERLRAAYPELADVAAASDVPVYVVGGAVRDALLGRGRSDNVDVVIAGDALALAARLGGEGVEHERFATAKVDLGGLELDIATARTETYARPGALPEVTPADSVLADLDRRDFTVNAIAVGLDDEEPLDPYGGRADLAAGLLRVLHRRSFVDDPTRALRAARYAARFGFELEGATEQLLRETELEDVSADRREAELRRIAAEPEAPRGLELLASWGLVEPRSGGIALATRTAELLASEPWAGFAERDRALLAAALGPPEAEVRLAAADPGRPSEAVALAHSCDPIEILLARALGAEWLDRYMRSWRDLSLEIDGDDLIAAGVSEGPAVGRGLEAALRRKLDGELEGGREAELAAAIEAAEAGERRG